MKVTDIAKFEDYPSYAIEFGISTWTENLEPESQSESVRNRYNTEEGKFNYAGSSELGFWDLEQMIIECLKRDKISNERMIEILEELTQSLKRKID